MIDDVLAVYRALETLNLPQRLSRIESAPRGGGRYGGGGTVRAVNGVGPGNDGNITLPAASGLTSPVQDADIASATNWNSKQAGDATLTALAAYNTNGLLTQTAADTFTGRTITGTLNVLSVANGSGVAGNPTLTIDAAYVGQSSITTLGTITTGVWSGTAIDHTKLTGIVQADVGGLTTASAPSFAGETLTGDLTLSTHNLITDTTTGTKLGTATTQKLGFYNATPIVQPSGNALTALTNLGLVATPTLTSANVGLGSVENTALSTWAGTTNITTLGTIATGTWNGGIVTGTYGGTGVNNGTKTITLGNNVTTSGNFALTLTQTAATNVTLPTTGTLATLAGSEILTNKTLTTPTVRSWDGWEDANETWTFASADGPTGVITVPTDATTKYGVGMRVKLTQTTVKYFIVTAVAATALTVYGGTDYTLANAAISANFYSPIKAPLGLPLDPTKWTVQLTDTTDRSQATPTASTFYSPGGLSISIPIGVWDVLFAWQTTADRTGSVGDNDTYSALSTANNSASDSQLKVRSYINIQGTLGERQFSALHSRRKFLVLAAKTSYFPVVMNTQNIASIGFDNGSTPLIVNATCAYL